MVKHGAWIFQSTLPAGEATTSGRWCRPITAFQSTLPAGEATILNLYFPVHFLISIHASRGGSDPLPPIPRASRGYFNPRFIASLSGSMALISIHASRGGSDLRWRSSEGDGPFQSTLPAGEATSASSLNLTQPEFQSTLPAGEATQ